MPDYAQGKIYAIRIHLNEKVYVGSTTQPLSARMAEHRGSANRMLNKKLYKAFNEIGIGHRIKSLSNCWSLVFVKMFTN